VLGLILLGVATIVLLVVVILSAVLHLDQMDAGRAEAEALLREIPGIEIEVIEPAPRVKSLIGRIRSGKPGRRLIFNGHLDTFPILENLPWTVPPLGGVLKDGKLYGRGVSDMKGGLACSILAAKLMAQNRDAWSGEIVLTLAVFAALLTSAAAMVWVERRVAALLQQRMGPTRVGWQGLLQPFADVIKLMFKEELRPRAADPLLFALAPIISATAAFARGSSSRLRASLQAISRYLGQRPTARKSSGTSPRPRCPRIDRKILPRLPAASSGTSSM